MASESKNETPAGYHPLGVNNKQMDTYGLKTGPGRKDTVTHKLFNKVRPARHFRSGGCAGCVHRLTPLSPTPSLPRSSSQTEMLEEVQRLGFYSAWNDIRKQVEAYPADQLLLVADADEVYGENWFICLTEEAKERYLYVRLFLTRLHIASRATH